MSQFIIKLYQYILRGIAMRNDIELLAPAGSYDAFIAAVENGADAVYLGGKLFNARANASNFGIDELKKIIEYAHLRNVKIHITMNTLLDDSEISDALSFAYDIYSLGVDAVIVQDLGLAKVLHENIPNLVLHASTQLSAHNLECVTELNKLGFSRVVLARELTFDEIKYICNNTSTEIEIFSHGALCVCYSGQCLMSSMIGDRSGNRGKCAQPCRLPYSLLKNNEEIAKGYLLSPKDLCSLELLKALPNVVSLKIEGRMKSPEYVATVVSTYKKYINKILASEEATPTDEDKKALTQIFNRGGFSKGYLLGKTGKDMMCYEKPKNWGMYVGKIINYDGKRYITLDDASNVHMGDGIEIWNNSNNSPSTIVSEIIGNKIGRIHGKINAGDKVYKTLDKALNQKMRESFSRGFVVHSKVDLKAYIKRNEHIKIVINDFTYFSSIIPNTAEKQPITKEKVATQLMKTGNTPFEINHLDIELDNDLFIPVSALNDIRRCAFGEYEKYFLENDKKSINKIQLDRIKKYSVKRTKEISVFFNKLREEYFTLKNVDNYYFTFKDAIKNIDNIAKFDGRKFVLLPAVTKSNYAILIKENIEKLSKYVDGFVLSNIGQLTYLKNIQTILIANYTFNAFNTYSLSTLKMLGFDKVILSQELTQNQINSLGDIVIKREAIVYGNTCVMTSEYCPIGSIAGGFSANKKCSMPCLNNDKYFLQDRMNMRFRIISDNIDCQSQIFNSKICSIESNNLNVDSIRIDIIDEDINEIQNIVNIHKSGKKMSGEKYTNGHANRPV